MRFFNNTTLEYEFVKKHREQGKTKQYILDVAHEARDILQISDRGIGIALDRYDFLQKVRYFNLNHARNFRTKVREILAEKLEKAVEDIMIQDSAIKSIRVFDTKIHGYNKLCSNCGSRIKRIISANVKYIKILMGKDDGERGYFPAERTESIFYPCDECGATQTK